jgi:hypothetical protein
VSGQNSVHVVIATCDNGKLQKWNALPEYAPPRLQDIGES